MEEFRLAVEWGDYLAINCAELRGVRPVCTDNIMTWIPIWKQLDLNWIDVSKKIGEEYASCKRLNAGRPPKLEDLMEDDNYPYLKDVAMAAKQLNQKPSLIIFEIKEYA